MARGDELLPASQRDLNRGESAAHHNRRGDHDAARRPVGHDEVGADAEHSRLQHVAQHFRSRAEIGKQIAGADVFAQVPFIGLGPARGKSIHHAKCPNDFGIALRGIRQHLALGTRVHRGLGRTTRHAFGQPRHGNDGSGPEQRRYADRRMKQKQGNEKDRYPGHVQKCRRPHARHEGSDLIEIAQRLLHQHRLDAAKRQRRERGMDRFL